jgi:hypothetical protein
MVALAQCDRVTFRSRSAHLRRQVDGILTRVHRRRGRSRGVTADSLWT